MQPLSSSFDQIPFTKQSPFSISPNATQQSLQVLSLKFQPIISIMSSSELNTDEGTSMQQSKPTLCSNGCGFFGTSETNGLCSKCHSDYMKSVTPQQPFPIVALSVKKTPNSASPVELSGGMSSLSLDVAKKKNRCGKCNKKVGLLGFKCRCGNMFCGSHRYAEAHDCDFDFKAKGRSEILKANPVVKADKLEML